MITLPITCRQAHLIIIILITCCGINFFTYGTIYDVYSAWFIGVLILGVLGTLLGVTGLVLLLIWITDNVKCKCDKS